MSALAGASELAVPRRAAGDGFTNAYRAELQKLLAQLTTRLVALFAVIGPFAFAAVLKVQSGTPSDALFGAWVHSSGFAISLVILGFAGTWGFPIIAGVLVGDLFASEDRHGTWKTILTRSCTREDVFTGKLAAAGTVTIAASLLLAASSLLAGIALVGAQPLVNFSGVLSSSGHVLALTLVSWLYCLLPVLAYTSLAILFSVATRNGILGVLGPLIVALLTQLLDLIGKGVIVHTLLIGSAFDGWHGLFVNHPFFGPFLASGFVCLVWIAVCLGVSWRILRRRDFLTRSDAGRTSWTAPLRVVVAAAAAVAILALCASLGPTGVTARRVSHAIGAEFNNVTLLQQQLIGRQVPAGAKLDILPTCNRRAAAAIGPGDWNCNIYVYLPQPNAVPFQQTAVEYDVSVEYNGCYKAQSPPAFLGGPTMRNARGRNVTNPLYIVYGCFNEF
ncbi:MAG TPA: ABC transporter permease [Solirubrobacteraceae bacterium]|nr:ABC transporter permease [Solirubrobacteraceae bacterium]